jgi:phosphoglycerol transferase MdoB-like AlkP superfamily enzyme
LKDYLSHIKNYFIRIGIAFIAFTVCRILFYIFNASSFEDVNYFTFIIGLRFDAAAIAWLYMPFTILSTIPIPIYHYKPCQKVLSLLFFISNGLSIVLNCIDIEYYKFTAKRTTTDILQFINTGNDFKLQVPKMMLDYWYLPLIALFLTLISQYFYKKLGHSNTKPTYKLKWMGINLLVYIPVFLMNVVMARGGIQLKPIDIIHASSYSSPLQAPIILNTPFAIIKTLDEEQLTEYNYFENQHSFEYVKSFKSDTFIAPNIFMIVLESFSVEYTNDNELTPFFDSLSNHSIKFTNCYANGKKSIEGIPALVAGLPTLMNDPFISSLYASNKIHSLASVLKSENYTSNFYHGGFNGTMGFESFCRIAGYDNYIGKTEYNNDEDYDGQWGIYDQPFFKFVAEQSEEVKEPFFNTLFSLSNHHPFSIPNYLLDQFPEGNYPIHKTVRYTDWALNNFFNEIKEKPWFDNTVFIITSDHSAPSSMLDQKGIQSTYHIPLIIFGAPIDTTYSYDNIVSQIDIMPIILDLIGYQGKLGLFGAGLENKDRLSIHYINNCYEVFFDQYLLRFDGKNVLGLFDTVVDPKLEKDMLNSYEASAENRQKLQNVLNLLKSFIQQYNYMLIHNELTKIPND